MNGCNRPIWGGTLMLLEVKGIHTMIGRFHILQGVSFGVPRGAVTVLLGRNGAGKTTTIRSIMGLSPVVRGEVRFEGEQIQSLPTHVIARKGIGYVPEDMGIFGDLTVEENLKVAMGRDDPAVSDRLAWILELFPDLKVYWRRKGGQLSGGQKQMLSIARAFIQNRSLLLIDEPSKGLAPIMVDKMVEGIRQIKERTTILLVEQNFSMAQAVGDRFVILDGGRCVHTGPMDALKEEKELQRRYLGIA